MINIYKYTFYRTYTWRSKKWRDDDVVTAFRAVLIVAIFASLNISTIGLLLQALGLINVDVRHLPKVVDLLLFLSVTTFLYFSFVYHERYKIIEQNYRKESLKQRNINSILVLLYVIASSFIYVFI